MISHPHRIAIVAPRLTAAALPVGLGLLLALGACSSKEALDATVAQLRRAAEKNDYAAFSALAHPALVAEFPREQLARLSQALARLGRPGAQKMTGISAKAGGLRGGDYTLSYDKGPVELELTLREGKLVAFNFKGEALQGALQAVQLARFAQFEVADFFFVQGPDDKRKPSNVYGLGEPVAFKMIVHGLTRKDGTLWPKVALRVRAGDKVVLEKPEFLVDRLPLPEDQPKVATISGTLKLPGPGRYRLELTVADGWGTRSLQHAQALEVAPPGP